MPENVIFSNKVVLRGGSLMVTLLPAICDVLKIVDGDLIELEIKNVHKNNKSEGLHEEQNCDP